MKSSLAHPFFLEMSVQKKYHLITAAAAIVGLLAQLAIASTADELEKGLLDAMRLNKETNERVGDSGKAIQGYMREGFLNRKPNRRVGYTDYYLLKKPASFMGHELVLIEEEYMLEFIGCCVNAGVGVSLRVNGSTEALEQFAEQNGCKIEEGVGFRAKLAGIEIKATAPNGNYLSLSCRERDVMR